MGPAHRHQVYSPPLLVNVFKTQYAKFTTFECSVLFRRLGIEVKDFGPSWRTGLAFFAVIHALRPNRIDMEQVWRRPNRENLQEAFLLAETELGIPQLLDPEGKFHFLSHLSEHQMCTSVSLPNTICAPSRLPFTLNPDKSSLTSI